MASAVQSYLAARQRYHRRAAIVETLAFQEQSFQPAR
jgi:hypothetical protein